MAQTKKSSARKSTSSSEKPYTKSSRCWPGYEPVPGKVEHEEGSCRKKPARRNAGKSVDRETARKKQIKSGGERAEQAHRKSPKASERRAHSRRASKSA
jgi:hypothetical protein